MKADFKKYRITAFALLIILGINVVMPAAVLAVGFYCNADSDSSADTIIPAVDCCIGNKLNSASKLSGNQDIVEFCTLLRACNQSVSDPFTKLDSLLPAEKKVKVFIADLPFLKITQYPDTGWDIASHISLDTSFPYPAPPVFLVNSTFLN